MSARVVPNDALHGLRGFGFRLYGLGFNTQIVVPVGGGGGGLL